MRTGTYLFLLCFIVPFCWSEEITDDEATAYQAAVDNSPSSSPLAALIEFTNIAVVGAGWAGSYAGWRLATSNLGLKVRQYEKLNRIGGRAFFVDSSLVPEMTNGLEENMGGYRFNEKEHVFIYGLVKTFWNIPTRCFSYSSWVNQTTNCPLDQDPLHVYARGVFLTPAQQANSANWPYNFQGVLNWTSLANRPNPTRTAVSIAFPFVSNTVYPNLNSCNDTLRWQTVDIVTSRIKNCATDPDCHVPGGNPNSVPIKYFIQNLWPEEYFAADDAGGTNGASYLRRSFYQSSIYSAGVSSAISFGLTGCGGPAPFNVVMEGGGRKGYATAAHLMVAAAAQAQGVAQSTYLKFNHQLYSIRKWASKYLLKFTNGKTVVADKVILNMGFYNLVKHMDKHDNILFDNADANLKALYTLSELTGTKTFIHYPKAWWIKAGLTKGAIMTDEIFKLIRFHGGHVVCPGPTRDPDTCHGNLLTGYQILHIHETKGIDYQTTGPDDSSNLQVLRRANARDAHVLDMLHTTLLKVMQTLINFTDPIPAPDYALMVNWIDDPWNRCGAYAGTTSITPGTQELKALRPLANEHIYLAQIDWMATFGAYAEAGLIMAERIANRYFGLTRPSYLPQGWYDYVIKVANH